MKFSFRFFIVIVGVLLIVGLANLLTSAPPTNAAPAAQQVVTAPGYGLVEMRAVNDTRKIKIPAPAGFNPKVRAPNAVTININYLPAGADPYGIGDNCIAWPANAQAAFAYAMSLAAARFTSVPAITVDACWANNMGAGVLGHSTATSFYSYGGVVYPKALVNALVGSNVNASTKEIYIAYSSIYSWYYGTDANPTAGTYDLVSVAFHEVFHGMGFLSSFRYGTSGSCLVANTGCFNATPYSYDRFVYNGSGQQLNTSYISGTLALGSQLTSNNLFFSGANATAANGGNRPRLYAPSTWSSGSSISHLDYNAYSASELMVYAIGAEQAKHSPGPVTMGVMRDIGWPSTVTTRHVTNANDAGAGSLRQALADASAGDTIVFDGDYTINLASELSVNQDVIIDGTGRAIMINGGGARRVVSTTVGSSVTLNRLNIAGGNTNSNGAGIYNNGALRVINSAVTNNNATTSNGGGIFNNGTLNVVNSTLSGNNAASGGALYNETVKTAEVTNSTLASNTATNGGGYYGNTTSGAVRLNNSIVASNTGGNCGGYSNASVSGNIELGGSSCQGATVADPKLGSLANNGGGSQTMKLDHDSAAIDAATAVNCPTVDQRGQTRDDLNCDAGAYEIKITDSNWVKRSPSTSSMTTYGPALAGIQDTGVNAPGVITVTKVTSWTGGTPNNTIGAWWEFTPTSNNGSLNLNLKICYTTSELGSVNESNLHFWRYTGSSWTDMGAPSSAPSGNCATLNGVTQLSRWALATSNPSNAPTAVTLASFNARNETEWWVFGTAFAGLVILGAVTRKFVQRH